MKIFLSNDDGYKADGINTVFNEFKSEHDVVMVAPHRERSSCGHGITLGRAISIEKQADNIYACSGKPADCILLGFSKFDKPDLVISGINHGANLGQDRFYSGTIAAAREASFRGVPSIAISLYRYDSTGENYFSNAMPILRELIASNIHQGFPFGSVLNINLPNIPWEDISSAEYCISGHQIYTEEVKEQLIDGESVYFVGGEYAGHKEIQGTDASAVASSKVSIELQTFFGHDIDTSEQARKLVRELVDEINRKVF